ncbi:MAG: alpha/beta hydrolase, partial [Chitinophagaceae bacterium]|nr:alpha/beta hydrolase [Chitinophagaceae bacterium]
MISNNFVSPLSYQKIKLSNGHDMAYIDEGAGAQTILFIHGLATFGGTWQQNIEGLKNQFRCIGIDLPGNGYSDKGDMPYSIKFYATCVYDFIKKMKLENVVLCGHSMGGQIAMTLLLLQPDAAEKLVLCAPAGFEQFNVFEKTMYRSIVGMADMFSSNESNLRQSIYTSFYRNPNQADGMIDEMVKILKTYPTYGYKKMMDASIGSMLDEPVYDRLSEIKVPALIIFGEIDALIPNKLLHPIS